MRTNGLLKQKLQNYLELIEESVCAKIAHTAEGGKKYLANFYNLDAVISLGY